ncbi:MAG TPA: response regulator [Candidatus Acidoferrum sp.]
MEDSEPLRKLVKTYLDSAGFRVFSAESGEAALELFTRIGVTLDLLLTDVVMPGMNGRALAEHLLSRQPGMKVLYMSGLHRGTRSSRPRNASPAQAVYGRGFSPQGSRST